MAKFNIGDKVRCNDSHYNNDSEVYSFDAPSNVMEVVDMEVADYCKRLVYCLWEGEKWGYWEDELELVEGVLKFKEGDILVEKGGKGVRKVLSTSLPELEYRLERLVSPNGEIASGEISLDKIYVEEAYKLADKPWHVDSAEEFKKGDYLISTSDAKGLTVGKTYMVVNTYGGFVRVTNDSGILDGYRTSCFEKIRFVKVQSTGIPTPKPSVMDFTPKQLERIASLRVDIEKCEELVKQKRDELDQLLELGGKACIL